MTIVPLQSCSHLIKIYFVDVLVCEWLFRSALKNCVVADTNNLCLDWLWLRLGFGLNWINNKNKVYIFRIYLAYINKSLFSAS